jgi:hypothetical protein
MGYFYSAVFRWIGQSKVKLHYLFGMWMLGIYRQTENGKSTQASVRPSEAARNGEGMSYEIVGNSGKYWTCHQSAWSDYLVLAVAFGWAPDGAFFKCDEGGFGEHVSGSYLGNDWQMVTDDDARAMATALNLAIAVINAGAPLTQNQANALKAFAIDNNEWWQNLELTKEQRNALQKIRAEYLAAHPSEVRTLRTHRGTFDVDTRSLMDLADVVGAGGFRIA